MATRLDRFAAVFAGGILALRAVSLFRRPLWFDEIFTLWLARQNPSQIVEHLRFDSGPPLYYFFVMPFVRLGETFGVDAVGRMLSFFAVALLFWRVPPRYSGGARFAILLAASPLLFFYSGEARVYSLLAAFSFLLFLAAIRGQDTADRRMVAALAAGILPWIHYLGALVVLGSVILCALRRRWTSAALQLAAASLFLLWLPIAAKQPALSLAWNRSPPSAFLHAPEALGFWGELPVYFSARKPPAAWLGTAIGLGLLVFSAIAARKSRDIRDALAFSLLPIALVLLASLVHPIYYPGRTEMATLPVALWGVARAARRSRIVEGLCAAAVCAGLLAIGRGLLATSATIPYVQTARFLESRARPGDLVVSGDADYLPLRLAKDRGRLAAGLVGIPAGIELHPGWFEPEPSSRSVSETARLKGLIDAVETGGRIDFAIPPDPQLRELAERCIGGKPRLILRPPGAASILEVAR